MTRKKVFKPARRTQLLSSTEAPAMSSRFFRNESMSEEYRDNILWSIL